MVEGGMIPRMGGRRHSPPEEPSAVIQRSSANRVRLCHWTKEVPNLVPRPPRGSGEAPPCQRPTVSGACGPMSEPGGLILERVGAMWMSYGTGFGRQQQRS